MSSKPQATCHDARLSIIWTQEIPGLFTGGDKQGLRRLSSRPLYVASLGSGGERPSDLGADVEFPWPRPTGQKFWQRYIGTQSLLGATGDVLWSKLVPVRLKIGTASGQPGSLSLEAFFYPHGLAIVGQYRLQSDVALGDLVDRLVDVLTGKPFELKLDEQTFTDRLSDLALAVMSHVAAQQLGVHAAGGGRQDPFTVCTIVRASGPATDQRGNPGAAVQQVLHGLASWSPTWQDDGLDVLDKTSYARSNPAPGHLVYVAPRGRSVWFPSLFGEGARDRHSLSCFHRNLTLLSMTVDSLSDLAVGAPVNANSFLALPFDKRQCIGSAVTALGALYAGAKGTATYRSGSVPYQMAENGGKVACDALAPVVGH